MSSHMEVIEVLLLVEMVGYRDRYWGPMMRGMASSLGQ